MEPQKTKKISKFKELEIAYDKKWKENEKREYSWLYNAWDTEEQLVSKYHIMEFIRRRVIEYGEIGVRIPGLVKHFNIPSNQMAVKIHKLIKQGLVRKKKVFKNNKIFPVYTLPESWMEKVREKRAVSIFEILPEATLEKLERFAESRGKTFDIGA